MVGFLTKQSESSRKLTSEKSLFATKYALWCSILLCLSVWIFLALSIPINNDEAIHFQPIACSAYPFSWVHQFRERCGEKDLFVFNVWLPMRSFWYAGASSALFFVPFWWLFNDPLAIRVWEGVLWLLSGYLMSRIIRVPWSIVASVVLLSIPFLAQHVLDTGPIALQLVMVQAAILLILKAVTEGSIWKLPLYGAIAGVCIFVAIEQKAFVVYATPLAIYLLCVGVFARYSNGSGLRMGQLFGRFLVACLASGFVGGQLLKTLFFARNRGGGTYWEVLQGRATLFSFTQIDEWASHFWNLFSRYAIRPTEYFHRNYLYQLSIMDSFTAGQTAEKCLLAAFALIAALLIKDRRWRQLALTGSSLLVATAALFLIARSNNSTNGHHVIFAHIIALAGAAVGIGAISRRYRLMSLIIVGVLLYSNLRPCWKVALSQSDGHADPTRNELFKIVDQEEFARKYLVAHTDWGTYFIDALFGPKSQAVTWIDRVEVDSLKPLAQKADRKLAFIKLHDPNWDAHGKEIGLRLYSRSSSGQWDLWVEDEHALTP